MGKVANFSEKLATLALRPRGQMDWLDPGVNRLVQSAQLPVLLQVEPETRTLPEQPAQPHGHVGRHAPPATTDVADLRLRHAQALVDANAVLAGPVSLELFEPPVRKQAEISER